MPHWGLEACTDTSLARQYSSLQVPAQNRNHKKHDLRFRGYHFQYNHNADACSRTQNSTGRTNRAAASVNVEERNAE